MLANWVRSRDDNCTWLCLAAACDPNTRLPPRGYRGPRIGGSCQRSQLVLHNYENPRILQHTRYPADRKTCNLNQIYPPKMQSVIRLAVSGAEYVPATVRNGCDSCSDDSHVRWSHKRLEHLLRYKHINYRGVGCGSPGTRLAQVMSISLYWPVPRLTYMWARISRGGSLCYGFTLLFKPQFKLLSPAVGVP